MVLLSITGITNMQLSDVLIESLLNQDEGPTLDFKRNQYKFKKSATPQITDNLRSELVKDILAFANTQRISSAFVLIGVEEVYGGRSKIIGVTEHLVDNEVHDLMNKLTNRPVHFSYRPYSIEKVTIGVIEIPVQGHLIYLKNSYGKLRENTVYVRDGSSTRIATPDEIVEMSTPQSPCLGVDWTDPGNNEVISSHCKLHPLILLPTLGTDSIQRSPLPYQSTLGISTHWYNEDYPVDLIIYTFHRNACIPLSLQIRNHGEKTGENVRFEGLIAKCDGLVVMDALPDFPTEIYDAVSRIYDRTYASPTTEIRLSEETDYWGIQVEFGNVRPGERIIADDQFWLSSRQTMSATISGKIIGENIPEPIQNSLELKFEPNERPMTIEDINNSKLENS